MNQPPRNKPPPPPPQAFSKPSGIEPQRPCAPPRLKSEGIMLKPPGPIAKLLERLRPLLPAAIRNTITIDGRGTVFADGKPIGIREGDRLLIDYSPMFSHIPMPTAMRTVATGGGMKAFLEITESESFICAGDSLGQKKLYSRIG